MCSDRFNKVVNDLQDKIIEKQELLQSEPANKLFGGILKNEFAYTYYTIKALQAKD
jgi:hypothetical protein